MISWDPQTTAGDPWDDPWEGQSPKVEVPKATRISIAGEVLEVEAVDAAGNHVQEKVSLTVQGRNVG